MMESLLLGARLFRLPRGSKQPTISWKKEARLFTEETIAREYFTGHNVGMVCDSDFVIIDIEGPKKQGSPNGWPHLRNLEKLHGCLPMAPQYSTPSGGGGIVFRAPEEKIPFIDLGKKFGLELRTGAHFNLIPESYYDGVSVGKGYEGYYNWTTPPSEVLASEGEIPVIPSWLVDFFKESEGNKETITPTPYDEINQQEYERILLDNLPLISSNVPYPKWWEIMAICYRLGDKGKDIFIQWSKETGGERWKGQKTIDFINSQWQALSRSDSERSKSNSPRVGISRLLERVIEENPVQPITFAEAQQEPELSEQQLQPWPLLPLPGAAEEFRLALKRSMPWQEEALYTIPLLCLQATLQRKIVMWRDGLQSHWWSFVGGPASNKTTFKDLIYRIISDCNPKVILESLESTNGLRAAFAEYPSRALLLDEGLKQFNAALSNETKSKADAMLIGEILNRHNNKADQQCSTHKKKEDRIPFVKLPQLLVVTFDQETYWDNFRSSQAVNNGLLSRFFMIRCRTMPASRKERETERLTSEELKRFCHAVRQTTYNYALKNTALKADGTEDFEKSAPDLWGTERFAKTSGAIEVYNAFADFFEEWASKEQERIALVIRATEGAKLLGQLCAAFDNKDRVEEHHAKIACGIAACSLKNVAAEADPFEMQIIEAAMAVLKKHKTPMTITMLMKYIPQRLWRGRWKEATMAIRSNMNLIRETI